MKDKSTTDTSLEKGGTVCIESTQALDSETACVAPARVLNSDELSDHERVWSRAQGWKLCSVRCMDAGEGGVTFALIQRRDLEDVCQLTFQDTMSQESGQLPDDSQFIVTRKARFLRVAHYQTKTPEKVKTIFVQRTRGSRIDKSGT